MKKPDITLKTTLMLIVLVLLGCQQATSSSNDSIIGTWVFSGSGTTATWNFKSDGTGTYVTTGGSPSSNTITWAKNGSTYSGLIAGAVSFTAALSGSILNITVSGSTFPYTKQ